MSSEYKPSVGRILHYVIDVEADHLAAIVTRVNQDGSLDLAVFNPEPDGRVRPATNIVEDIEKTLSHTWHWPERV
jgi:hypothetical protein